jgi:hypothetical protein
MRPIMFLLCIWALLFGINKCNCELMSQYNFSVVGSSWRADLNSLDLDKIISIGSTHVRLYCHFSYIIPVLDNIDTTVSVDNVKTNFDYYETELNKMANWKMMDSYISTIVNNTKLIPIIELGEGTISALPKFAPSNYFANNNTNNYRDHDITQLFSLYFPSKSSHTLKNEADNTNSSTLTVFDPNIVGINLYLGYIYLYVRTFTKDMLHLT